MPSAPLTVTNPAAAFGEDPVLVTPGPGGAHNWFPMAFSPQTGLAYFPAYEHWYVYAAAPTFEERLDPAVAWLLRDLMRAVVTEGTGAALKDVPRPLVGKTGTTNDARDAWFVGLLPEAAIVAWVGFDDNRTLGRKETGGHAVVPVVEQWIRAHALEGPEWPLAPAGTSPRSQRARIWA
jgi:membrane peptidoglycan carboxypeptidase